MAGSQVYTGRVIVAEQGKDMGDCGLHDWDHTETQLEHAGEGGEGDGD